MSSRAPGTTLGVKAGDRSRPARDVKDRASICLEVQGQKSRDEPDRTGDLRVSEVRSGGVEGRDAPPLLSWAQVGGAVDRDRSFIPAAMSDGFEPDPVIVILCCARTQHEECGTSERTFAAAQRDKRSFMQSAA